MSYFSVKGSENFQWIKCAPKKRINSFDPFERTDDIFAKRLFSRNMLHQTMLNI